METLMTVGITEAAQFLKQTTKTLQRWDNTNVFPAHKTETGHRFYYQNELTLMKELLNGVTRKKAAELIGVSDKTLWRWDKKGIFPHRYVIGKTSYYFQSDIDRYLSLQTKGVIE